MRFLKNVEIVNIFRIQVKRSTFVKFQLKIDENNLIVNKNWHLFGGQTYYSRKENLNKKLELKNEKWKFRATMNSNALHV